MSKVIKKVLFLPKNYEEIRKTVKKALGFVGVFSEEIGVHGAVLRVKVF